jgi:hypothetical protein
MKKTLPIIALVLLSLVSIAWVQSSKPVQWEYKFDFNTSEKKANELGAQGWELVAIQSTGPGVGHNVSTYAFRRVK